MAQADTINNRLLGLGQDTLAGPAQERLAGRKLREDRMGERKEKSGVEPGQQKSWAESRLAGRIAAKQAEKKSLKEKAVDKAVAPVRMGTSWLLKQAWLSIGTVVGFIFFGLPYINLHVFGRYSLSDKLFRKLGDEWKPAYKDVAGAFGQMGRVIGIVEVMALLVLDLAVISVVAMILVIIILLVTIIAEPWKAVDLFGFSFIWEAIKALF